MPIEINYLPEGTGIGVEMTGTGNVTGQEICDALKKCYSSENLPKQKYQIWYFENAETFDCPNQDFDRMVNLDTEASRTNPNIVVAVVGKDDFIFGISRMWETYMEIEKAGFETMTFRKREAADAWISSKLNSIEITTPVNETP